MFKLQIIIFFSLIVFVPINLALPLERNGSQNKKAEANNNHSKTIARSSIRYGCVQGMNLCKQAGNQVKKVVHDLSKSVGLDPDINQLKARQDKLRLDINKIDLKANKNARAEYQRAKSGKTTL